ncbi:MAG: hypothetical protein U0359_41770 [Byssovorax sp.]
MQALGNRYRTETERRAEEPHTRLAELKEEALTLLNRSSALERELTEVLREAVNAETGQRLDDFTTAETVHRRQATVMLFAMLGILLLTGVVIYLLFLSQRMGVSPDPRRRRSLVGDQADRARRVGRLAILFFAQGLKYTGSLHRQHAEQAVICHVAAPRSA